MNRAAGAVSRAASAVVALVALCLTQPAGAALSASPTRFAADTARLDRIGARLRVASARLCSEPGRTCAPQGGRLIVIPANDLNAWADGRNVRITARMVRFAGGDDELAFVVSHEMAHNLLGHAALQPAADATGLDRDARHAHAKRLEIDADALAVSLLRDAGFAIDRIEPFIARRMHDRRQRSRSHPGTVERIAALRIAIGEPDARLM